LVNYANNRCSPQGSPKSELIVATSGPNFLCGQSGTIVKPNSNTLLSQRIMESKLIAMIWLTQRSPSPIDDSNSIYAVSSGVWF